MKKSQQTLILIAIYVLALGIRVYWLSQKEGLHVDEGLTIALACYNDFMITNNYEYGKKYTGKELKEASMVNEASLKSALTDVRSLWRDTRDPPHTNLYYTFFRLSLVGLKTGDIAPVVLRGGILNLLFFTVSFVFFFRLMQLLFAGYKLLQYAATFCAFMSTAAISNTLFLRPYQMQETLFIIFCYYFVLSIGWQKYILHENTVFISIKPIVFMSLITAVTLMTGYYALIFIGLFGLYAIYLLCRNKRFIEIPFYFMVLCFGILFAQALYPKYVSGFFSYRGQETIKTISGNILENIRSSVTIAGAFLHKHFFSYPVIAICVLCLAYIVVMLIREQKLIDPAQKLHDKKTHTGSALQKITWCIFSTSVLFLFIVLILAPYKVLRYVMPVFPFLVILPAMLINAIGARPQLRPRLRTRRITAGVMLLLCGCFAWNAAKESKIENIFRGKPNGYVFTQDKDTPVYVLNAGWSLWKYADLIPYVHDEQAYYFIDWFKYFDEYKNSGWKSVNIDLPEVEDYDTIYLLAEYIPEFSPLDDLVGLIMEDMAAQGVIESEFEIYTGEPGSSFPYYIGKKIKKNLFLTIF
jgi:hypothetical protein